MTVPASRRGKSRMEVFAKANELCSYTVEITANERTFKPEFAMLTARIVASILENQYTGDVGVNPGSQLVQIAGVSVLSPIDHMVKGRLVQVDTAHEALLQGPLEGRYRWS